MKQEIENLNLLYGVSIFNIISKNKNIIAPLNDISTISIRLNKFFEYLNKQENVNEFNIFSIALLILDDQEIWDYFTSDNFKEKYMYNIILDKLKNINFNDLNSAFNFDFDYYYLDYSHDEIENDNNIVEYIKELLYESKLIYADLIMLLINNWKFPKKIEKMFPDNWTTYFINTLNLLFYELNNILKLDRKNLYYISMLILESPNIKHLLYPHGLSAHFNKDNACNNIKHYIYDVILLALHNINPYYYIEYSDYYNSSKTHFYHRESIQKIEFVDSILNNLNLNQIIFLFRITNHSNKITTLKNDDNLKELLAALNKNNNITIYSQEISENIKQLIQDSYSFICEYVKKEKLNVKECSLAMNYKQNSSINLITVNIEYKHFIYKFVLSKYNQNYTWKVFLQKNKIYKINMCLPDDFKHLVQMMKNDIDNNYYNIILK